MKLIPCRDILILGIFAIYQVYQVYCSKCLRYNNDILVIHFLKFARDKSAEICPNQINNQI